MPRLFTSGTIPRVTSRQACSGTPSCSCCVGAGVIDQGDRRLSELEPSEFPLSNHG